MDLAEALGKGKFGKPRTKMSSRPMPQAPPPPPSMEEEQEGNEMEVLSTLREQLQAALDTIDSYLGGEEEATPPELPMGE